MKVKIDTMIEMDIDTEDVSNTRVRIGFANQENTELPVNNVLKRMAVEIIKDVCEVLIDNNAFEGTHHGYDVTMEELDDEQPTNN